MQGYHTDYGQFPYNCNNQDESGSGRGSMLVRLLPYIEEKPLYQLFSANSYNFNNDNTWETTTFPGRANICSRR